MRQKLPSCRSLDPNTMNVRAYGNGSKIKLYEFVCYGAAGMFQRDLFEFVFLREAVRLMGPPWNAPDPQSAQIWLENRVDSILNLLSTERLGLFNKKVDGDETDWRALAAFANWYWWLSESGLADFEADVREGNPRWAEYVVNWVKPNAPAEVVGDPVYASTDAMYAQNFQIDTTDLGKGLASRGPWPVALPSGTPATIPGLPAPCEDFPACILQMIPMAAQALWDLVQKFATANPSVKQLRGPDGMMYSPDPPPAEVADNDDAGFQAGADVVVGFTAKMALIGLATTAAVVGGVWYLAKKS